jgi:hypothetical protein
MFKREIAPTDKEPVSFNQALESSFMIKIAEPASIVSLVSSVVSLIFAMAFWTLYGVSIASIAMSLLFFLSAGIWTGSILLTESPNYRDRFVRRRQNRLNRNIPWAPREGERHPPGRDDRWPRWTVRVTAGGEAFTVNLIRWQCDLHTKTWYQVGWGRMVQAVDLEDIEGLGEARFKAQVERDGLNLIEQEKWQTFEEEKKNAEFQLQLESERAEEERRLQDSNRALARSLSD